eukprot:scaffold105543_cov78-Phaeocystis_antarctica.AAC.2
MQRPCVVRGCSPNAAHHAQRLDHAVRLDGRRHVGKGHPVGHRAQVEAARPLGGGAAGPGARRVAPRRVTVAVGARVVASAASAASAASTTTASAAAAAAAAPALD